MLQVTDARDCGRFLGYAPEVHFVSCYCFRCAAQLARLPANAQRRMMQRATDNLVATPGAYCARYFDSVEQARIAYGLLKDAEVTPEARAGGFC